MIGLLSDVVDGSHTVKCPYCSDCWVRFRVVSQIARFSSKCGHLYEIRTVQADPLEMMVMFKEGK